MPWLRYVCAAHKVENLSARDSRRMRQLITSEWYVERWGDRFALAKDQNEKLNFQNSVGGFRIATAITSLTGIRGDRVIIDDPHSVDSAASETQRETEVTTFLEAIPTRLNNPVKSAIVVIMQRLHQDDVSGVILDKGLGYDHIMLPMRYDPVRASCTKLGYEDPREEDGELLFPERFPLDVVDRDERAMGPYATAGQHQQEPAPRGGGVIKRDWWVLWEREKFPPLDYVIASLDTAYTTKTENDFSAMTVWGIFSGGDQVAVATRQITPDGDLVSAVRRTYTEEHPKVVMLWAWQERLELHELVVKVEDTMRKFKVDKLLVENKAAGISVAQELRRLFNHVDFAVQLVDPKSQDKLARVHSIAHLFAEGLIYAPDRAWADNVIKQCEIFPKGKNDDLVDTVSMVLKHLRETGLLVRGPEWTADIEAQMQHTGSPPAPLYSV
jgi:predicted phage terminase large subunit-like protein